MSHKNIADDAVSEKKQNFSSVQTSGPRHAIRGEVLAAIGISLSSFLESASSFGRHGLSALTLCCAVLVPILVPMSAYAAITDCEGTSIDGQAQCVLPEYGPTHYGVCDIAGTFLYRQYAWEYCAGQMGLGTAPILSEETAVAYADCFDRRLNPSGNGVSGAVPWLPVGTLYHDNLCVVNTTVRAMNGHELWGVGNKAGSSSNFAFTRWVSSVSCPAGTSAAAYVYQHGVADLYRCKPNPACNPDQELRDGVCWTKVPIDKAANCLTCDAKVGNPIYPLVGVKAEDVATGFGLNGMDLVLHYDTTRKLSSAARGMLPTLGKLWSSSLHKNLVIGSGAATILAHRGNGSMVTFVLKNGAYVADADVSDSVVAVSGTYRYMDAKSKRLEIYNSNGQLTSLEHASGGSLSFTYSPGASATAPAAGYLMTVTDNVGRFLQFEYALLPGTPDGYPATAGVITRIVNSAGQVIVPGYDTNFNLVSLTWPDTKTLQFLYENSAIPWAMTGRVDENASRHATWSYDAQGRAVTSSKALGVDAYSVSYGVPPQFVLAAETTDPSLKFLYQRFEAVSPTGVSVTGPNGQAATWKSSNILDRAYLTEVSQPSGSGSDASTRASAYDAAGNVVSRDDFKGQRTCYAYDGSNRETVRVEGLTNTVACASVLLGGATLPADARKITTSWHPDWRLPMVVNGPLSRTTTVYHGQPDPFDGNTIASCAAAANLTNGKPTPVVCKQVEEALLADGTVDATALPKVRIYTYDAGGRMLTSTDTGNASATVSGGNPSAPADPSAGVVALYLRGNGANGSTTIVDDSPSHKTITLGGNAKISTAQSVQGGSSMAFDGSGDYLSIPYSTDFAFGSGDFTIETFVYKTGNSSTGYGAYLWSPDGNLYDGVALLLDTNGNGGFGVYLSVNGTWWDINTPVVASLAQGQWYHLAVVRNGGSVYAFVNGVKYTITTSLGTTALYTNPNAPRVIGGLGGATPDRPLNGYIDDFRITKGKALYTENFTPPAQGIPSVAEVSRTTSYSYYGDTGFADDSSGPTDPDYAAVTLLLHGNGTDGATAVVDDSPSHKTITLAGNAKISTAQSVQGGSSMAFDGAGDYLSIPYSTDFAFGSGDFTMETFLYKNANNPNLSRIWSTNGDYYDGVALLIDGSGNFGVYLTTTGTSWNYPAPGLANIANGQWYHLAVVRSGGSIYAFVNGVRYTITTSLGTQALYANPNTSRVIGGQAGADRALNGYIDEFRITKGKARYTTDFTPPTQAFPSQGLILNDRTIGDLKSITNPAGHVTQFTQYDKAGRVRQSIDPKGIVTDITYTPRGWVNTLTTTAPGGTPRVTSYTYDNVGQLTGVAQPDGSTLSYSYDAAHRLVGVTDAKGNSVTYTLDNVGNRIAEEIKDPTGTLQRSISRSFDALNRVQQVTGAAR